MSGGGLSGKLHVISLSGGKDSMAMWLWARRVGLAPRVAVACDTGWEFEGVAGVAGWHEYLDDAERVFGEPVLRVKGIVPFPERVLAHNTFPGRVNRRWCTEELKIEPFKAALYELRDKTGLDVVVLIGIRHEESAKRAAMPEREWAEHYDCEVWRPIIDWTLEQVIAEHHAGGMPLNPLYLAGAERVGCWPCIKAGKRELRLLGQLDPKRVEKIRELEAATNTTMFCLERPKKKGQDRKLIPQSIDKMIRWANTSRGGQLQLPMYSEPTGCARWGICEAPIDAPATPTAGQTPGAKGTER